MKGKKDFTTKKSSKVFNRRKHYQKHAKGSRVIRRPYAKKGGEKGSDKVRFPFLFHSRSGWQEVTRQNNLTSGGLAPKS